MGGAYNTHGRDEKLLYTDLALSQWMVTVKFLCVISWVKWLNGEKTNQHRDQTDI